MTTSITINSLQRFDYEKNTTTQPNPFDFYLDPKITSNWVVKRRPFSRTALTKVTDAFSVKVCRVFIPKALVPNQQAMLFLQIMPEPAQLIDKEIGPRLREHNIFEGVTGPCNLYADMTSGYANTWTLYPACTDETPTHWLYTSCTDVSINNDWKARNVHVIIRDQMGYTLQPPNVPANGITGFNLCDFKLTCPGISGITGCRPSKCCPITDKIAWEKQQCAIKSQICLPDPVFYPLFQQNNQVMVVLEMTYVEFDGASLTECFS